ncbi:MAG: Na+/H+ antiporter NhaC family protein [Chloroflexota bacterium]
MSAEQPRPPGATAREPSLLQSIFVVAILIALIATTVVLFGTDATNGPLQVALFMSAVVAGFVSLSLGHRAAEISGAVVGGISSAMQALFILLAVGALIGTFNMAGTIPAIVYYGIGLIEPSLFYLSTAIVCALVGLAIGSSWTTAATLGVGFVALAPLMGASAAVTAGAVVSGAYFGDKMTPLSETTVLVPSLVGGVSVNEHIAGMLWSSGPAFLIALVLFALVGLATPMGEPVFDPASAQQALANEFHISLLNFLPLVALVILSIRRVPPFLAIFTSAVFAGFFAWFTQPQLVATFAGAESFSVVAGIKSLYLAMGTGFESATGVPAVDTLFSGGGMSSMLTTIWLILGALSYAAVVESGGYLARLIRPVLERAKSTGALIAAVVGTAIGLNIVAGDQYVAIVMPSRVFRVVFAERGIAPRTLSRTVEDSGTVTSPLVPWNSCGAYISGVLGVATLSYLPYCFFNLLSPLISLVYGFTGFRIERVPASGAEPKVRPQPLPEAGA